MLSDLSRIGRSLMGLAILVILAAGSSDSDKKPDPPSLSLSAIVLFDGNGFIISNQDKFDWKNVEFDVNGVWDGYRLKAPLIRAGQTYTLSAMQFAKKDGTRFNPSAVKPQELFISCDTEKGHGIHGETLK